MIELFIFPIAKYLAVGLSLTVFCFSASAQDQNEIIRLKSILNQEGAPGALQLDAASALIELSKDNTDDRCFGLIERAAAYLKADQHSEAKADLDEVETLMPQCTDSIRGKFFHLKGAFEMNKGNLDESLSLLEKSLALSRKLEDKDLELRSLIFLGINARYQGMHLLAASYHENGIEIIDDSTKQSDRTYLEIALAKSLISMKMYDEALAHLQKVRHRLSYQPSFGHQLRLEAALAEINYHQQDYAKAKSIIENVFNNFPKDESSQLLASVEEIAARTYIALKDYDRAFEIIQRNLSERDEGSIGDHTIVLFLLDKIDALMGQGKYKEALEECELVNGRDRIETETQIDILNRMICCNIMTGNFKQASMLYLSIDQKRIVLDRKRAASAFKLSRSSSEHKARIHRQELREKNVQSRQRELDSQKLLRNVATIFSCGILAVLFLYWNMQYRSRLFHQENRFKKELLEQEVRLNGELKKQLKSRVEELERQKVSQLQLQSALSRKHRDEAIGQLTAGVAHDFNNLITVIENSNALIELMLADQLPKKAKEVLNASNTATDSAARITQRLLTFAKQNELNSIDVNLRSYFEQSLPLIRQTLGDGVRIISELPRTDLFINIDIAHLTTALINLASNSAHAMDNSGMVKISVCHWSEQQYQQRQSDESQNESYRIIEVPKTSYPEGLVQLSFEDSGHGMDNETLKRVCDPFFTTRNTSGGTGLGLSVVRGFLEQSGAGLEIVSSSDGTVVSMIFPSVKNDPSVPQVVSIAGSENTIEGLRVFLVDDNQLLRSSLKLSLEIAGCRVTESSSGKEAQQIMIKNDFAYDVLVSDIRMPESIDGIQLAEWLTNQRPEIPVLLISGYCDAEIDPRFKFLAKPFKSQELVDMIQECVENGSPNRSSNVIDELQTS